MKNRLTVSVLFAFAVGVVSAGSLRAQEPSVEAQVATAIVDRMPEGSGMQFPADVGELYVWSRVMDAGGTSIQHVWMHEGNEYPVTLAIGGSPWRTWSSKAITPDMAGEWQVLIRAQDGTVLQTLNFTVG